VKIHVLDGTQYRGQIFAGMSKDHGALGVRVRQFKKNNWACRWSVMILWSVGYSLQIDMAWHSRRFDHQQHHCKNHRLGLNRKTGVHLCFI